MLIYFLQGLGFVAGIVAFLAIIYCIDKIYIYVNKSKKRHVFAKVNDLPELSVDHKSTLSSWIARINADGYKPKEWETSRNIYEEIYKGEEISLYDLDVFLDALKLTMYDKKDDLQLEQWQKKIEAICVELNGTAKFLEEQERIISNADVLNKQIQISKLSMIAAFLSAFSAIMMVIISLSNIYK